MNLHFREATEEDADSIVALYRRVAESGGAIARDVNEINSDYVKSFLQKSKDTGLIIVCEHPERERELIAEIHASKHSLKVFKHVLSDLTIVVDPEFQSRKIGRTIFTIFLQEVVQGRPDVGKIELMTRESNSRAISLYQRLGFRIEGRLEMRIRNADGTYEADIPMGWQNPNYEF